MLLLLHVGSVGMLADQLSLSPDSSALPGGATLQGLANGIGWWALLASLLGLVIGAATWAVGSHTNNYQHRVNRSTGGRHLGGGRAVDRGGTDPSQLPLRRRAEREVSHFGAASRHSSHRSCRSVSAVL